MKHKRSLQMGNFDALNKSDVVLDEVSNNVSRQYANYSASCYVIIGSNICISTSSSEIKKKKWRYFLYFISETEERHFIFVPWNYFELFHLRVYSYVSYNIHM